MKKWQAPFFIMLFINILILTLFLPPILANTPPPAYYRKLPVQYRLYRTPLSHPSDSDDNLDSDKDGLSDYDEIHKYRTDPDNTDSDNDGISDSDWNERRESTYTIRAVLDLRQPYSLNDMNDFYQDARLIAVLDSEVSRFEVILYPRAKEQIRAFAYVPEETEYTKKTFSKNYSRDMQKKLISSTSKAETDLQALLLIQREFNKLNYISIDRDLGFTTDLPLQFQYYRNEEGQLYKDFQGTPTTYSMEKILDSVFFADTMFGNKTRGACSSSATVRGAMMRAAGLEEQTIFTIPLYYSTVEDGTVVEIRELPEKHNLFCEGGIGISDHFFNVVHIGGRWLRVDRGLIDTGVYGPYIKLLQFDDQSEINWELWNYQDYFEKRPYRYIYIGEQFPGDNLYFQMLE